MKQARIFFFMFRGAKQDLLALAVGALPHCFVCKEGLPPRCDTPKRRTPPVLFAGSLLTHMSLRASYSSLLFSIVEVEMKELRSELP